MVGFRGGLALAIALTACGSSSDDSSHGSGGSAGAGGFDGIACDTMVCGQGQACCGLDPSYACGTGQDPNDPCYDAMHGVGSGFLGLVTECDGPEDCPAGTDCCYIQGNVVAGLTCVARTGSGACDGLQPACHSASDCASGTSCEPAGPGWFTCQ